jgi:hypothetical protein
MCDLLLLRYAGPKDLTLLQRYTLKRPETQRRSRGGVRNGNVMGTVAA